MHPASPVDFSLKCFSNSHTIYFMGLLQHRIVCTYTQSELVRKWDMEIAKIIHFTFHIHDIAKNNIYNHKSKEKNLYL